MEYSSEFQPGRTKPAQSLESAYSLLADVDDPLGLALEALRILRDAGHSGYLPAQESPQVAEQKISEEPRKEQDQGPSDKKNSNSAEVINRTVSKTREELERTISGKNDFNRVVEVNYGKLLGFVRRMAGSQEVAEDLVQETIFATWKSFERIEGSTEIQVKAWLFRVAKNKFLNHKRKAQPVPADYDPDMGPPDATQHAYLNAQDTKNDPLETIQIGETLAELQQSLQSLHPHYREMLQMVANGNSYQEVADQKGITISAVKSILVRARKALNAEMDYGGLQ